jgi:hypothetical protein
MATSTLQTDLNEDLYLVDGRNLAVLTGKDALVQSIRQATRMRTTENVFNVNEGVDFFGTIFSSPPDYDAARKSIADAILSVPDTISIEQLTITIGNNAFSYSANVQTIYGLVPVGQSISQ